MSQFIYAYDYKSLTFPVHFSLLQFFSLLLPTRAEQVQGGRGAEKSGRRAGREKRRERDVISQSHMGGRDGGGREGGMGGREG